MPWVKPPDAFATPHFHWQTELACKHCGLVPGLDVVEATAEWLERLRHELGDRVLHINSACRCEVHNAAIGGAPASEHIRGFAADITVRGLSPREVQKLCRELQREGKVGGLGLAKAYTHVDRGPKRTWTYP